MFIPDPEFYPSRILDPTTAIKLGKKKSEPFYKGISTINPKNFHSRSQMMGLGSGIPDPGVKKAPDYGSGPATLTYELRVNYTGISTTEGTVEGKKTGIVLCLQNHM
jgi:hypothetical protein